MQIAGREFVVGDRVIARRNDRLRDVDNGMRGTVVAVDPDAASVTLEADAGGRRELDRDYVEQHLEHAYALTGHGTQGGTVERAVVVGRPEEFSLNWGYTALSRARATTTLELVAERREHPDRAEVAPSEDLARSPQDALATLARRCDAQTSKISRLEQLAAAETSVDVELDGGHPVVAQPVAQEAATDRLDAAAARAAAAEAERSARNARRDTVQVPDPLAAQRRALGPERAARLPEPTPSGRAWLAERSDRELAELAAEHAPAIERLDTAGAREAARLDAAAARTASATRRALASDGWRRAAASWARCAAASAARSSRSPPSERDGGAVDAELERLDRDTGALRVAGRHPDQWMQRDADAAVTWAEATREQAVRRELELRAAEHARSPSRPRTCARRSGRGPSAGPSVSAGTSSRARSSATASSTTSTSSATGRSGRSRCPRAAAATTAATATATSATRSPSVSARCGPLAGLSPSRTSTRPRSNHRPRTPALSFSEGSDGTQPAWRRCIPPPYIANAIVRW